MSTPLYSAGSADNTVAAVKHVQQMLNAKGYTPALVADGDFGPLTTLGVKSFQFLNGVADDGVVGPITLNLLKTKAGKKFAPGQVVTLPGVVASTPIDPHQVTFNRNYDTGTVATWAEQACALRGVTDPAAVQRWVNGLTTAAGRESSGNQNAANLNDLNNITPAGYAMVQDWGTAYTDTAVYDLNGALTNFQCSRGVVQDIPQTFAANWCPGSTVNIYDPASGMSATMGYVVNQYSVAWDASNLAQQVQQFDPSRPPMGY